MTRETWTVRDVTPAVQEVYPTADVFRRIRTGPDECRGVLDTDREFVVGLGHCPGHRERAHEVEEERPKRRDLEVLVERNPDSLRSQETRVREGVPSETTAVDGRDVRVSWLTERVHQE